MIIVGARGFAKEILEIFHLKNSLKDISFYDDVNPSEGDFIYDKFPILRSEEEAKTFFRDHKTNEFTIGIGNPVKRHLLFKKFQKLGGHFTSSISPQSRIGNYDVSVGVGSNVLSNAIISNSVSVGSGCLLYYNTVVTHDCSIGDFVELSPGATLLGRCRVGSYSQIGSNATILPDIVIGNNVIVGAGAVVTKDIPNNSVAVGVPARIIKNNLNLTL